jgi:hypothetical protein
MASKAKDEVLVTEYEKGCSCDYSTGWQVDVGQAAQMWQAHAARAYDRGPHIGTSQTRQRKRSAAEVAAERETREFEIRMYYSD